MHSLSVKSSPRRSTSVVPASINQSPRATLALIPSSQLSELLENIPKSRVFTFSDRYSVDDGKLLSPLVERLLLTLDREDTTPQAIGYLESYLRKMWSQTLAYFDQVELISTPDVISYLAYRWYRSAYPEDVLSPERTALLMDIEQLCSDFEREVEAAHQQSNFDPLDDEPSIQGLKVLCLELLINRWIAEARRLAEAEAYICHTPKTWSGYHLLRVFSHPNSVFAGLLDPATVTLARTKLNLQPEDSVHRLPPDQLMPAIQARLAEARLEAEPGALRLLTTVAPTDQHDYPSTELLIRTSCVDLDSRLNLHRLLVSLSLELAIRSLTTSIEQPQTLTVEAVLDAIYLSLKHLARSGVQSVNPSPRYNIKFSPRTTFVVSTTPRL